LLLVDLAKTGKPGQTTIERPDHEGYRPLAQEERERTRQDWCHRHDAQNDIELARNDAAPQLSPGAPFKGNSKRITEGRHCLAGIVRLEDPSETPSIDALEQWHPDHLDGSKRCLCAAHRVLTGRSNDQSDVMELGKRCRMRISDISLAGYLRIRVRR